MKYIFDSAGFWMRPHKSQDFSNSKVCDIYLLSVVTPCNVKDRHPSTRNWVTIYSAQFYFPSLHCKFKKKRFEKSSLVLKLHFYTAWWQIPNGQSTGHDHSSQISLWPQMAVEFFKNYSKNSCLNSSQKSRSHLKCQ